MFHSRRCVQAQALTSATPITIPSTDYSGETPQQQSAHHEIEQRYGKRKRAQPTLFPNLRKSELERLFADRCGDTLPDDDAGRGDLRLMADHLAQLGEDHVRRWADAWAPWASEAEIDSLIKDVGQGRYWKPVALGRELNLDDATRERLKINTIRAVGWSTAKLEHRHKERDAAAARDRRANRGAKPHAQSEARLKPWVDEDMSESTWHRRKRAARDSISSRDSDSSCVILESQLTTNYCQQAGGAPAHLARAVCS